MALFTIPIVGSNASDSASILSSFEVVEVIDIDASSIIFRMPHKTCFMVALLFLAQALKIVKDVLEWLGVIRWCLERCCRSRPENDLPSGDGPVILVTDHGLAQGLYHSHDCGHVGKKELLVLRLCDPCQKSHQRKKFPSFR